MAEFQDTLSFSYPWNLDLEMLFYNTPADSSHGLSDSSKDPLLSMGTASAISPEIPSNGEMLSDVNKKVLTEDSDEINKNMIAPEQQAVSPQETDANLAPDTCTEMTVDPFIEAFLHNNREEIYGDKLTVEVVEKHSVCKKSENTGYHVIIDNWMTIKLEYDERVVNGNIYCLAHLQRTNPDSQDLPVNKVCKSHAEKSNSLPDHVLQTRSKVCNYFSGSDQFNSGVCEEVNPKRKTLEYKFVCFDSCQTNAEVEKLKERDRDMNLVLTLLQWSEAGWEIFARKHVSLWIKATINDRDLGKKIRREEKGGRKANKRSASPIEEEDETMKRKYLKFLQENNYTHDDIDRVMKPKSKKSGEKKVLKDKKPGEKKVSKDKKPKKTLAPGAAGCLKKPLAPVTDSTLETEDSVNTDPMKCFENALGNAVFLIN